MLETFVWAFWTWLLWVSVHALVYGTPFVVVGGIVYALWSDYQERGIS